MAIDAIDASVPSEQFQRALERLRHDPPHPGILVRVGCLGHSPAASKAARQLSVTGPDFERILAGESGISPDLTVRIEALGWATAAL